MSRDFRKPHGYSDSNNAQEVRARIINAQDPQKAGRYQVRIFGDQDNIIEIPDKQLVWASCMRNGFSSHRGMGLTAMYKPGDVVLVKIINGQYIIMGSFGNEETVEGEKADQNPMVLDGTSSWKSPPSKNEDSFCGWLNNWPSELTTTLAVLNNQQARRRDDSKKSQGESKCKPNSGSNKGRSNARFLNTAHASIAKLPYDRGQDFKKPLDRINNKSSVFPTMLDMVDTLRNKPNGSNPTAINSVGPQNYVKFISDLQSYFPELVKLFQKFADSSAKEEQEQQRQEKQLREANLLARKQEMETLKDSD